MSDLEEQLLLQIRAAGLPEPEREVRIIPGRPEKPNRLCEVCQRPFYASPGHIAKGHGRFCSLVCRSSVYRGANTTKWKGDEGNRTCPTCGTVFRQKPTSIRNGKAKVYCNAECRQAADGKVQRVCAQCGVEFSVFRCWIRHGAGIYCSKACLAIARTPKPNSVCLTCGSAFYRKPSDLATGRGVGSFCSMRCKAKQMSGSPLTSSGANRTPRGGKRPDLGFYVRSMWEANYARYLKWLVERGEIKRWEYEPDTFEFTTIKRGSRFYTPDFKVFAFDDSFEYHEVKGWMSPQSATKLKRMTKYYPHVKIVLIDGPVYRDIAMKVGPLVPNWEAKARPW